MALTEPGVVVDQTQAIARRLTHALLSAAEAAVAERGQFRIALAGGSTPRACYELLAQQSNVVWSRWHVFFSDERCVAPDDPHSNFRMAHAVWLGRVAIPEQNVHRMRCELDPEQAARAYERELGSEPLDLVLLGMGEDGHTASLFPASAALDERSRLVVATRAPIAPEQRLTLTFVALDAARAVYFFVCGASKAARLAELLAERKLGRPELPAARVNARSVGFFVDSAAAAHLASQ